MMEFGKTLREAREKKGYGVSQLAEMTHILPQIIENLEREDFSKVVAPIYGRGFVKLYCEAVGIDPKPLISEFMDIYSGNRPPAIRMRDESGETQQESPPVAEPSIAVEPPIAEVSPPVAAPVIAAEPPPMPSLFDVPPVASKSLPVAEEPAAPVLPQSDTAVSFQDAPAQKRDYRLPGYSMPELPKRYWRFGVLIAAALAIIALLAWGTRQLYRATMGVEAEEVEGAERVERVERIEGVEEVEKGIKTEKGKSADTVKKTSGVKPVAPRQGVKIPSLYID